MKFFMLKKGVNMFNILTFILIIIFFFLLFMIIDGKLKQHLPLILALVSIYIVFFGYYMIPVSLDFINDTPIFVQIDIDKIPSWQHQYTLNQDEEVKVLEIIGSSKGKRISKNNSFSSNGNYIFELESKENHMIHYMLIINPDSKMARLIISGKKLSYVFDITSDQVDFFKEVTDKYKNLAFIERTHPELGYDLDVRIKENQLMLNYNLVDSSINLYLDEVLLYRKKQEGHSIHYIRVDDKKETAFEIPINTKSLDESTDYKLIIRGVLQTHHGKEEYQHVITNFTWINQNE